MTTNRKIEIILYNITIFSILFAIFALSKSTDAQESSKEEISYRK